jgi:lipopolysaccharide transport system permease protein
MSAVPAGEEIVIRPPGDLLRLDVRELYRYRHLLRALIRRNLLVQFGELSLGPVWACVRPLLYVAVFVALGKLANADPRVVIPYPLYLYSGLILWYYVVDASLEAAAAVRNDAHLITKVYYPRILAPLVPVVTQLYVLAVSAIPLGAMMCWYGTYPGWRLVLLPLVIAPVMAFVLGLGTAFAAFAIESRDWERVLGVILYLGLFVSPVIYAPEMIPGAVRVVYFLNPIAGALGGFRAAMFADVAFPIGPWSYSLVASAAIMALGTRMYRVAEGSFADRL